jgi:hypothetical protein
MGRRSPPASLLSVVVLVPFLPACHKKIEPQECAAMLDRYIDMVVDKDLTDRHVPPEQIAAVRETKKAAKKAEASYVGVEERCENEVTHKEYECAMASKTADEWEACIE